MKTYLVYSNGVFIERIINPSDINLYLDSLVSSRGYRFEDLEVYEYDNDLVEGLLSQQDNDTKLVMKGLEVYLTKFETIVEEDIIYKENPKKGKPDISLQVTNFTVVKKVINSINGIKIK